MPDSLIERIDQAHHWELESLENELNALQHVDPSYEMACRYALAYRELEASTEPPPPNDYPEDVWRYLYAEDFQKRGLPNNNPLAVVFQMHQQYPECTNFYVPGQIVQTLHMRKDPSQFGCGVLAQHYLYLEFIAPTGKVITIASEPR